MSTDRRFIEDLNALVDSTATRRLPEAQERGPIQSGVGYVEGEDPTRLAPGIASPLSEPHVDAREYYESAVLTSPDGLFTLEYAPIKRLSMRDALGAEVVFQFADPSEEEEE